MDASWLRSMGLGLSVVVAPACGAAPSIPIPSRSWTCGGQVEQVNDIAIYSNGPGIDSCVQGDESRHLSADGYSYGKKWQCVEFVRRYYKDHLGHRMPERYGHATDYFREELAHGARNTERDLIQLRNGGPDRPRADDLLVFREYAGGYGHVGIIVEVGKESIVLAQQNSLPALQTIPLKHDNGQWTVGKDATGFLRREVP